MNNKFRELLVLSILILFFAGCGNSSSQATNKNGIFIDDVVSGIKYVNGNNTGLTNDNGEFPYTGGVVEFYLGSIKIGEVESLKSDGKVFIQDIVGIERNNIENEKVLKIATLLQSLDSNSKTDKIEINGSDFEKFNEQSNKDIDDVDVDALLSEKGISKVSQTDVKRHLNNVLKHHKVVNDETILKIKNTSVKNGDYEVEYDSSFDIEFTKDIKKDDIKKDIFILKDSKGNILEYDLEYNYDIVKIIPAQNLTESEQYIITIKVSQIEKYDSNNNDDITISFSAKSVKPTLQTNMDQSKNISISTTNWTFSGMARDDSGISSINLTLNGLSSNIELKNNFFDIDEQLNIGENNYKISVLDIEGNETFLEGKITVDLDSSNSEYLVKTNVENSDIVSLSSIWKFQGELNTNITLSKLTLEFNDTVEDINLIDRKFLVSKSLNLGKNSFKIFAQDNTGKKEIKQGTIYLGSVTTAGGSHSGALKEDKLYTWGRNNYGQAGLGYTSKLSDETNGIHPKKPIEVTTPTKFVSISFMQNFSVAIDEKGDVYTWGYDKNGELGRGKENRDNCSKIADCRLSIGKVEGLSNIVAIDAGLSHTLALDKNGDVYAFGTNNDGELGNGTTISDATAVKVLFPQDNIKIVQVTAGSDFSMAIDENGDVWGWGKNNYGQMAQGTKGDDQLIPLKIKIGDNEKIASIAAGTGHILALTQSGDVYAWGNNFLSQIGYRGYQFRNTNYAWNSGIYTPTKILTNYKNNPVLQIYAGGHSSYILRANRKVYPWGMYGETTPDGKQEYNNLDFPEDKLTAITSVKDMAAGALHVTAIKDNNTVFTWRWSFEGSLGGGDSTTNIWFYNYPVIPEFPNEDNNSGGDNSNNPTDQSKLTAPGGNATVEYTQNNPFLKISNNISENEISGVSQGRELFIAQWNKAPGNRPILDGLGPLFNANACTSCHISDGRVSPYNNDGTTDKSFLFRVGNENGDVHPIFGGQLQTQATNGLAETSMTWVKNSSNEIEFISSSDVKTGGFNIGGRISPHLIGMGLLDLVSEETILEYEDIHDSNNDGISGRAHWVMEEGKRRVGRFGWKAINSSLRTQNAGAMHQDMGLTTPVNPEENCTDTQTICKDEPNGGEPEVSEVALQQVVDFMTALSVPDRRINNQENFDEGSKIFETIGCASCHRPTMTTGISNKFSSLSNQKIYPYTDLLLHDMGEKLSDGVKEKDARGSEFRTAPLWGIGIVEQKEGARFLHDGRASSIKEAIEMHGGEAQNARDKFMKLEVTDLEKLMEFIKAI
ncbi:di-heme oxidoredictase family protein [Arcobacter sp. YIC-80]|uniref:RCC1 domain-containing protein n=1 Tax=Arcobacter sp. YIC-80 TaxID=3376683 RepID=UPI00384F27BF